MPPTAQGLMRIAGTRRPKPMLSTTGGATWSYSPPQSSHPSTMAVLFQAGLASMALMRLTTYDSLPALLPECGWPLSAMFGMTHETAGRLPLDRSVKKLLVSLMLPVWLSCWTSRNQGRGLIQFGVPARCDPSTHPLVSQSGSVPSAT